jgi:hypothetical protein
MPRPGRPRDLHKEQFWRQTLQRLAASRLSAAQFCHEHKLSLASLWAWKRKLRRRDATAGSPPPRSPQRPPTPGTDSLPFFVPLRLKSAPASNPDPAGQPVLEIVLPNGLRLRVPPHFDSSSLQQCLSVLRGVVC